MVPRWLRGQLGAHEIAVYVALSWRVDENASAWPSHATLADDAGVSVSTVKRCLRRLGELGVVEWDRRSREDGGKSSNMYRLHVHRPVPIEPAEGEDPPRSDWPTPIGHTDPSPRSDRPTPSVTQADQEVEPLNETHRNPHVRAREADALPPVFEAFCSVWPGNVPVRPALAAWTSAVRRTNGRPELILSGAGAYARYVEASGTEAKFVRNVVKWLNEDGWLDRLVEPPTASRSTTDERVTNAVTLANRLRAEESAEQKAIEP
jgi:GntR family transcriptional regulator